MPSLLNTLTVAASICALGQSDATDPPVLLLTLGLANGRESLCMEEEEEEGPNVILLCAEPFLAPPPWLPGALPSLLSTLLLGAPSWVEGEVDDGSGGEDSVAGLFSLLPSLCRVVGLVAEEAVTVTEVEGSSFFLAGEGLGRLSTPAY